MADDETPIEEWKTSTKTGKRYVTVKGPGGGTIFQRGDETVDEARLRHAVAQEAKRRQQRDTPPAGPARPKGKGRSKDKPPSPPKSEPAGKPKPSRAQLAAAAELPLKVLGAFVGQQMLGCAFCANAMSQNAGPAAADLAKTQNPYLLSLLTWWHGLIAGLAGGEGLAMYVAPPLVHHVIPAPAAAFVSPILGIPPRQHRGPVHYHGPGEAPPPPGVPGAPTAPPGYAPPGGAGPRPMTPQEAASLAAGHPLPAHNPGTAGAPMPAGGQQLTTEQQIQMQAERAALEAERARLQAEQQIGARQQAAAAAAAAGQVPGNVPAYRAQDTLSPTQLRQIQAAQEAANAAGSLPNYHSNGGQSAPGTPPAPGADAAPSAGSPLPPEAET